MAFEKHCGASFGDEPNKRAGGDVEWPVRAFRDATQTKSDRSHSRSRGAFRNFASKGARRGNGARGVTGRKRLLIFARRTARAGVVITFIEQRFGTGPAHETFRDTFCDVRRCDSGKHRKARVGKTPIARCDADRENA